MCVNQTHCRVKAITFHRATSLDDPFLAHILYDTYPAIKDLILNSWHPQLAEEYR